MHLNQPIETVKKFLMKELSIPAARFSPPRDEEVMLPSPKWIAEFADWISKAQKPSAAIERWDCDDFAFWASTEASLCRAMSLGESGHAVFIAYINVDGNFCGLSFDKVTEHACLLIVDSEQTIWFLEPQTGYTCEAKNLSNVFVDYIIV